MESAQRVLALEEGMDIRAYNRAAWNKQVEKGNPWTIAVSPEQIAAARKGSWQVVLTPTIPVPAQWFPLLRGARVLCLASGGGQQGPILAAAGADVTVLDNSPAQLEKDRLVAARENLPITLVEGDMTDLSMFPDESFHLIFHPVSNIFIPDILPVWRECYRTLKPGGCLLSGICNPVNYLFDLEQQEKGALVVKYPLPFSDLKNLTAEERLRYYGPDAPLEFSHSLQEQIGGQLEAGFLLAGFYEDRSPGELSSAFYPTFMATRAVKPAQGNHQSERV